MSGIDYAIISLVITILLFILAIGIGSAFLLIWIYRKVRND